MTTKSKKLMQAADLITGHAPRLSDEEKQLCAQHQITADVLSGRDHRVVVLIDDQHTHQLSLFRAIDKKFPNSGAIIVNFTSADARL